MQIWPIMTPYQLSSSEIQTENKGGFRLKKEIQCIAQRRKKQ
jgi:hypothetical protein